MTEEYREYFKSLDDRLQELYKVARAARVKGLDPSYEPEPRITNDIAERIEKLIGPRGITQRMRELEGMERREMAFKVAEEIALGRFGSMDKEAAADQAIRTALAIMTEGVTIAPIQGIPEIRIKRSSDRGQFLSIYFAGPIRPAGGTAQALTLVVADHVRRTLGLERFQASEASINRFIEEVRIYERSVRRFQYHVTDDDLEIALRHLPVEATGVSTDQYEVSNYRNVDGIETNRLRGGALIVVVDGIVGRARKLSGICENLRLDGWEWLNRLNQNEGGETQEKATAAFMEEIIVGRPVFSFPNTIGGFRLRYGRARTTGLAAVGINPSTMIILNKFLNTGVQLRIELPGKSASVCPVDSIEPPVVKLIDGSVIRIDTVEQAKEIFGQVEKILFNGDVLVNAGDFIQNNKDLLPAGYDEDQWSLDLENAIFETGIQNAEKVTGASKTLIKEMMLGERVPSPEIALSLTKLNAPLHPRYTYDWSKITKEALLNLRNDLITVWPSEPPYRMKLKVSNKNTLEILLVPHKVNNSLIEFTESAIILEKCLGLKTGKVEIKTETPLEIVNELAGFSIREKALLYVGARMGRPEKAKERKMSPYVHCLFPVGEAGGPQRNITRAKRGQKIRVEIANRRCQECGFDTHSDICPNCSKYTLAELHCPRCKMILQNEVCPVCKLDGVSYELKEIELRAELENAAYYIGGVIPNRIKCVKRLMNDKRLPEHLSKGILRARYDLSVFKDGTLRYDLTDIPLTHFIPKEVGVSIDRLRELGYSHDVQGEPLKNNDQMLELKVQDIVLPEACGDYMVKVTKFLDDLLHDFYKLERFYNVSERSQLVGEIVLGLAPHTSAAIVGRIIGWSKVRNCYAHPYWHAAKRRNCDGDEDAVMVTMDPLLNFSRSYLPEQSGGLMDAPLFIIPNLNPKEVDKESHNVDVIDRYPPEFYKLCSKGASPSDYGMLVDTLGGRLGTPAQLQGFHYTKTCSDINLGSHVGAYNELKTMLDKLDSQMELSKKLRAVDSSTVALKVLNSHFMKDIVGNLRAFTRQKFRCSKCNKKFRRPPLSSSCDRCSGPIVLTVHRGGIEKYIEPAQNLVDQYELGNYYAQRLILIRDEIDSIFADEIQEIKEDVHTQFNLIDFMRPSRKKGNK
jgi:DNA polymerase II large subunit